MTQEELNRFLRAVKRERFVDYLGVGPGEASQAALDQRLRWATRALNDPGNASEASFLLQHQDALRKHLRDSADDGLEEEWIEFAEPGEERAPASLWVGNARTTTADVVDLGELDAPAAASVPLGPRAQPEPQRGASARSGSPTGSATLSAGPSVPAGPPRKPRPRPAGLDAGPPAPDRTPAPFRSRSESPTQSRRDFGDPPVSSRKRARTPTPSISRLTPRPDTDRRGSSPIAAQRAARPILPPSEPPRRSHTPQPNRAHSPAGARSRSPSPVPSYSAPAALGATPGARGPSAVPAPGRGFDVQISGRSEFIRNNDAYGTSSVVYESEFDHPSHSASGHSPLYPRQTPSPGPPRAREEDILGNLRNSARKGGAYAPGLGVRQKHIPILGMIAGTGIVVLLSLLGWSAWRSETVQAILNPPAAREYAEQGGGFSTRTIPVTELDEPPSQAPWAPEPAAADPSDLPSGDVPEAADQPTSTIPEPAPAEPAPRPRPRPTQPKPADTKPADTKPADTKPADTKPADTKPADTKPADTKPADTKPADTKPTADSEPAPEPEPKPEPAAPKPPMAGAWRGTVGQLACVADLSQRDETVSGSITVAGQPFRVSGRHNMERGTILLRGVTDTAVEFRGEVRDGRVTGNARLGAGEMQQAWQLRR